MSGKTMTLSNGPLAVVLIQIKFSSIINIAKYIPDIQDQLRKKSYPLYDVLKGESIQTGPHGEINKSIIEQWVFSSDDYTKNIIIDSEKITYQVFGCREYAYDSFITEFLSIVESFDLIVDISSITRVGLRYINAIHEVDKYSWKELLNNSLHGMSFPEDVAWFDNSLLSYSTQRGVKLNEAGLISNFHLKINQDFRGIKYPPDIIKFPLGDSQFNEDKHLVTFLDLDHYILFNKKVVEKSKVFENVKSVFDDLHDVIEKVFFSSLITDKALEIWK